MLAEPAEGGASEGGASEGGAGPFRMDFWKRPGNIWLGCPSMFLEGRRVGRP
jgi:hypothetical protein